LPTGAQSKIVTEFQLGTEIEARILFLIVVQGFMFIIIAVVLHLQHQRLPGGLIGDSAKKTNIAGKHLIGTEFAAMPATGVLLTILEMIADHAQRAADATATSQVAPTKTERAS